MSAATALLVACGVIAVVSIPLILKAVPPNRWYGFRTPQTLSNEKLWFRANQFAGWAFLAAAVASGATLLLAPEGASSYGALVLVAPVGVALAVSLAYLRRTGAAGSSRTDDPGKRK